MHKDGGVWCPFLYKCFLGLVLRLSTMGEGSLPFCYAGDQGAVA